VKALIRTGTEVGLRFDLLESVEAVNERQKRRMLEKLLAEFGGSLAGKRIAVWGLAFKAETDDMRESPSIPLIRAILDAGGSVRAHDPKAMEAAREVFGERLYYARDPYDALAGADALVIVTEWLLYRTPDFERMRSLLRTPLVFDGRNLYDPDRMTRLGFEYHGIGRRRP
jgi:UDPglucose 6-dehydrogenase